MTDIARAKLFQQCGNMLANQLRNDFTPGEAVTILGATLDHVVGWLDDADALSVLVGFRAFLDQIEATRSRLH